VVSTRSLEFIRLLQDDHRMEHRAESYCLLPCSSFRVLCSSAVLFLVGNATLRLHFERGWVLLFIDHC